MKEILPFSFLMESMFLASKSLYNLWIVMSGEIFFN